MDGQESLLRDAVSSLMWFTSRSPDHSGDVDAGLAAGGNPGQNQLGFLVIRIGSQDSFHLASRFGPFVAPDQGNSELEPCASIGGANRDGFAVVFEGGGPSPLIFENDGEREGCFGESGI